MDLFCVHCQRVVSAEVVKGDVIYPHREDLYEKVFCRCPTCGNYVGCHKDGRPLGTIPTPELRKARNFVHSVIDAYWLPTRDVKRRKFLYTELSKELGIEYHTGSLNSVQECKKALWVYNRLLKIGRL